MICRRCASLVVQRSAWDAVGLTPPRGGPTIPATVSFQRHFRNRRRREWGAEVVMGRMGTTNWSLVLRAGADDSSIARAALGGLCEAYWYPV